MAKKTTVANICRKLPELTRKLSDFQEIFLANLVMLAEIPAPTFGETRRARFLGQRFAEAGLVDTSVDEQNNVVGVFPGQGDEAERRNILVVAHLDTHFPATTDHTIKVTPQSVIGPGVCDNGIGLAALASLPQMLERMRWTLNANLVLLGATRSLGRGDLAGLRFFLKHNRLPCQAAICLEGVKLGRLSIKSIGMLRGEITVTVPEEYDWTSFEARNAVALITEIVRRMLSIPLPRKPHSTIVLGSIEAGSSFNRTPTHATLRFEIKSESSAIVADAARQIGDICVELSSESRADIHMDVLARREPGGIPFSHPLVRHTRGIMKALNIPLSTSPSTSELASFIESGIPAITLGITNGERLNRPDEQADITRIPVGLAQLAGVLAVIDGGFCDED